MLANNLRHRRPLPDAIFSSSPRVLSSRLVSSPLVFSRVAQVVLCRFVSVWCARTLSFFFCECARFTLRYASHRSSFHQTLVIRHLAPRGVNAHLFFSFLLLFFCSFSSVFTSFVLCIVSCDGGSVGRTGSATACSTSRCCGTTPASTSSGWSSSTRSTSSSSTTARYGTVHSVHYIMRVRIQLYRNI